MERELGVFAIQRKQLTRPDRFTYTWSDSLISGNMATVAIDVYKNAPYGYDADFSILSDHEPTG